jgi:hypothetical protein
VKYTWKNVGAVSATAAQSRVRADSDIVRQSLANFSVNRLQCTDEEIVAFFGLSTKTIERGRKVPRFSDVMEQARAKGRVSVRRNLFRLASNGNVAAAILLAKNLVDYRDVVAEEVSGPDGRPIPIESRPDLSNLSDEELEQLKDFSDKAQPKRSG